MNTPHTPGPWSTDETPDNSGCFIILDSGPDAPCYVAMVPDNRINSVSHQRANARLIAAAPDLLAAAGFALQVQQGNNTADDEDALALAAAIRKATDSPLEEFALTHYSAVPPDPEGMNDERAEWAEQALTTFGEATRGDYLEDPRSNLVDLLCDLRHWADRNAIDFPAALWSSEVHYTEETTA